MEEGGVCGSKYVSRAMEYVSAQVGPDCGENLQLDSSLQLAPRQQFVAVGNNSSSSSVSSPHSAGNESGSVEQTVVYVQ